MKQLKEENFSLKLRIYMLEEERNERDEKKNTAAASLQLPKSTECKHCRHSAKRQEAASHSDSSATLSSSLSEPESHPTSAAVKQERRRRRQRQRRRTKSSSDHFYATDDEQKEIELENLNKIVYLFLLIS